MAVPTDSYNPVLFHTDNTEFQAATAEFGIAMTLSDSTAFDPTVEGIQTGATVDSQFEPPLRYRWEVENVVSSDERAGPGAHHILEGPMTRACHSRTTDFSSTRKDS